MLDPARPRIRRQDFQLALPDRLESLSYTTARVLVVPWSITSRWSRVISVCSDPLRVLAGLSEMSRQTYHEASG